MVLLSKFKEARGLGCLSSLLCTKEDPVLIESFVSQNVRNTGREHELIEYYMELEKEKLTFLSKKLHILYPN